MTGQVAIEKVSGLVSDWVHVIVLDLLKERDLTIFLVGGAASDRSKLRNRIKRELTHRQYRKQRVQVYYPEELYEGLMADRSADDLLALESKLANCVDSVVIVPESPGSYCELGAFASNPEIRGKLVVVVDNQCKKDKSFIMLGPVRALRETGTVVYHDYEEPGLSGLTRKLVQEVRRIGRNPALDVSTDNPVVAVLHGLVAAYIVIELSVSDLAQMMQRSLGGTHRSAKASAASAASYLIARGELQRSRGTYSLTAKGKARVEGLLAASVRAKKLRLALDLCRVCELNRCLRRRHTGRGRLAWNPSRGGVSPPREQSA